MERLKQAMERARAEREGATSVALGKSAGDRPSPRFFRGAPHKRLTDVKVDYTMTTTVAVDAEAMREHRVIFADAADPIADAYSVLRTHVLQRMRTNGWRTLAVTSPGPGQGKTLTAINLAISLAREVNQTVLLVDLDLKRPSVASYFFDNPTLGISDYLIHDAELPDLLINPGIERLVILPGHESFARSSEMLSSPRVIQLVEELKGRYEDRLIIFDMPSLFGSDDVIAFLPYLDAAMLVVEDGKVSKDDLLRAQQLLDKKNIGIVLNKVDSATAV